MSKTGIELAQAKLQELREHGQRPIIVNPIDKARQNPLSLRKAVTAKCYECMGFEKMAVRDCTSPGCPLFNVRPWQNYRISASALNEDEL